MSHLNLTLSAPFHVEIFDTEAARGTIHRLHKQQLSSTESWSRDHSNAGWNEGLDLLPGS